MVTRNKDACCGNCVYFEASDYENINGCCLYLSPGEIVGPTVVDCSNVCGRHPNFLSNDGI